MSTSDCIPPQSSQRIVSLLAEREDYIQQQEQLRAERTTTELH
jgi:hypothetical protein